MSITHLRSIAISAADPEQLLPFYEDIWGLRKVGTTGDGTILLRANGEEHHVLALVPGPGHRMDGIGLGASSPAYVDELAAALVGSGVEPVSGPASRPPELGGGYGVTFRDPEGRLIDVSANVGTHEPFAAGTGPGPDRLSHVVLNCTSQAASVEFYTTVLGFKVSDSYENDLMVFLRCNQLHHCVVMAPGRWTSLNHVAFEVASADEVMKALGRMRKAGVDTIWGPGRHGPGGNVFCYFADPVGNVIEYTAELLELDDSWEPQVWRRTPENADVWGTSGGITPDVIAAMSNPPAGALAEPERS
ncbi:VOC family protein [Dactylosporangium sp. CA-092794]|uniref:VOC family protein n=1 Tax=Dactylosporangium sp. CA-092794 TaxID=3239929 RepID=UPI003D947867